MDIIITMLGGSSVTLTVNPQDTVGRLKQLIQQKLAVPVQRQRLVLDNVQLSDDSRDLDSYGLHAGSTLILLVIEPSPPTTIQVFLRNEKGVQSTYDVTPDETVSDFKRSVESREGVPQSQQRLVFQGRQMDDGKLSDYNVKAHSTIELLMRLRGGK